MEQENNKLRKFLSSLISVFVVAWLGSYTYEAFKISDKADNLLKQVVNLPSIFHDSMILNSISIYDKSTFYLIVFCITNLILFTIYRPLIFEMIKKKKISSFLDNLTILNISMFVFLMVISYYSLAVQKFTVAIPNNNLEIVRPYVSNDEYLKLRSEYLQVDGKKSLNRITNKIQIIANENHLKLK